MSYNRVVNPLALASQLLQAGRICDRCLGRRFAALGPGLTHPERGAFLRAVCQGHAGFEPQRCWACNGVFGRVETWAHKAVELVLDREFSTFLFGVHLTAKLEAIEEFLAERFPSPWAEPLRRDLNRELGKAFERILQGRAKRATVDFQRPDVQLTVDLEAGQVHLRVAPAFFYGRYRKLLRGLPQTHWPCRACRGRGCPACQGTGKKYPVSVEEFILQPFVEATGGTGGNLHGAGREDIDARMLGRGRPFVVEVFEPLRRTLDLQTVAGAIATSSEGAVDVVDLRPATPDLVHKVKGEIHDKQYRARVTFAQPVGEERLQRALAKLVGEIRQRTPSRVRHRRADLVRTRTVREVRGCLLSPTEGEIEILCQGGLYVKELISGDGGATQPSLADVLGVEAWVGELDVLEVLDGESFVAPISPES